DNNKNMKVEKVDSLETLFIDTIEKVEIIFGSEGAYRRWLPENRKWKQQISAPLFDAQMFACYKKDKQQIIANKINILKEYKKLFTADYDFIDSIESSTASPNRFLYRTTKLNEIIERYI
ncbi:MAG: hypothetical protein KAI70_01430, partial [Candidatus Omnitrophica bacterium]|nr:hypothetical protein [Candidatus Omnitrophota bacterium]